MGQRAPPRLRLICPCCSSCAVLCFSLSLSTLMQGHSERILKHFIACVSCSVEGPTGSLVIVPRDDTVMCSQICVFQKLIEKGCRLRTKCVVATQPRPSQSDLICFFCFFQKVWIKTVTSAAHPIPLHSKPLVLFLFLIQCFPFFRPTFEIQT